MRTRAHEEQNFKRLLPDAVRGEVGKGGTTLHLHKHNLVYGPGDEDESVYLIENG